jgi:hypothetical protein
MAGILKGERGVSIVWLERRKQKNEPSSCHKEAYTQLVAEKKLKSCLSSHTFLGSSRSLNTQFLARLTATPQ